MKTGNGHVGKWTTEQKLTWILALSVTSFPIHLFVPIFPFPVARVRPPLSVPSFILYSSQLIQARTAAANELFFSSETPFSFFLGRKRFLFRRSPKKSLLLVHFIFLSSFFFYFSFVSTLWSYITIAPTPPKKRTRNKNYLRWKN